VIDYFLYIDARLVVMIYDLLLASILGICDSDASVVYPFPFSYSSLFPTTPDFVGSNSSTRDNLVAKR